MTSSRKSQPKLTPTSKRKITRAPASLPASLPASHSPRTSKTQTKTQTLMKVSSGEGWRNWVTLRLPAWLLMGFALLVLICVLTLIFSPDFAARAAVAVYEFIQHFTQDQK